MRNFLSRLSKLSNTTPKWLDFETQCALNQSEEESHEQQCVLKANRRHDRNTYLVLFFKYASVFIDVMTSRCIFKTYSVLVCRVGHRLSRPSLDPPRPRDCATGTCHGIRFPLYCLRRRSSFEEAKPSPARSAPI